MLLWLQNPIVDGLNIVREVKSIFHPQPTVAPDTTVPGGSTVAPGATTLPPSSTKTPNYLNPIVNAVAANK